VCGDRRACRGRDRRAGRLRGSAFGLLAAIQSLGNLAASGVAGLLWTWASPRVAFGYLAGWMVLALGALAAARRRTRHVPPAGAVK
jgi:MFS family permease